jgi:hypothetical protein
VVTVRAFSADARRIGETKCRASRRAREEWPHVDSLTLGSFRAFSPYVFLHRSHVRWFPSDAEWKAARGGDASAERAAVHTSTCRRKPTAFTFVRRPAYYAAFTTGEIVTAATFGLGLLWTPQAGTFLQSQTGGTTTAWGTRRADTSMVYEAATIPATFDVGRAP